MGNLMTSFNAGVSGLQSAQSSLNITAHNLANARTDGYTRQQVIVTDSFYQNGLGNYDNMLQVGTGTTIALTRQVRNEFLDGQYRLQVGRQQFYEANSKATMEIEDMLGELHGQDFQSSINDLWSAINDIAADPSDIVKKDQLVMEATQFIERAKVLQDELALYQTSLNSEVKNQVDSINAILSEVKELNRAIQKYEATGESANDYRDKRNQCLDELSSYIKFEVDEQIDGTITIYSEGAFLLDAVNVYPLSVAYESDTSKLLKPIRSDGEDYFVHDTLQYSTKRNTDVGSLRGLLVARGNYAATYADVPQKPKEEDYADMDAYNRALEQYNGELEEYNNTVGASVVMSVQSQLDTLVHGIVTIVNDAICPNKEFGKKVILPEDGTEVIANYIWDEDNALVGDDENKTCRAELFSRAGRERYTEAIYRYTDEEGKQLTKTVYIYNEEDVTDSDSLYTIAQLIINPEIEKDSSVLPTMYNEQSGAKEGYANNEWVAIGMAFDADMGTLTPNSLTTYTAKNFYVGMVNELATQGNVWNSIIENQNTAVSTLDNERQNVMGVSSDEELSNLIKYQQCYNASSRYITTVAEMLEYLIERLGS